jgi:SAM-dependent methyltransferase
MNTEKLYNATASRWRRRGPNSLSDFTGRPAVFDLCGDVQEQHILDLGCGEGYCARVLMSRGAGHIRGIDISAEMIELARAQEAEEPLGIEFVHSPVLEYVDAQNTYDVVLSVFLINYLTIDEMRQVMARAHHFLKPGGRFVFSVPHPAFPLIHDGGAPFYFDYAGHGYFSGRDDKHEGEIHCIDGTALGVQAIHKTVTDYFDGLAAAGFTSMPVVRELGVLPEHMELKPEFFGPVNDMPLHMAFSVEKA